MNHNQFDYETDLIYPLKEFLRRHTGFRTDDPSDLKILPSIFDIPLEIREVIDNLKVNKNCGLSMCFGRESLHNVEGNETKEKDSDV
jgi:hypothetical protein